MCEEELRNSPSSREDQARQPVYGRWLALESWLGSQLIRGDRSVPVISLV